MSAFTLVIGNKNYSSWSLRPWMLLKHLQIDFEEVRLPLDTPEFEATIGRWSPTRRVPVLRHGERVVWDSLAIAEYVAEIAQRGWPAEVGARALARSIAAEMHSGFATLRRDWPMNARAERRRVPMTAALRRDIDRIETIWADCRTQYGHVGPWLFGEYSVADAMYAPVVLRFRTYGEHFTAPTRAYMAQVLSDPILGEWLAAARAEPEVLAHEEVGE